ncbi:hypothetical protein LMG29542_02466 [Paraburkholderia humisilvae]|uniref:Uncharacterized protein n=1 Tax=Paraburkholderia humisilvae TaxID=627669 RepID=A0A6J5DMT9_9BURK|nr:hypothetical protein LMG29542_02466 [Paraburkholderia humisilvae]
MFASAMLWLISTAVAPQAVGQTQLPPLSVRIDACSRVAKVVNWIYQQRDAGTDQSVTDNAIQNMDVSAMLGPQITSITDDKSREGLREVIHESVEQAYSHPRGARTPGDGEALYFQGCAQGAAANDQTSNK